MKQIHFNFLLVLFFWISNSAFSVQIVTTLPYLKNITQNITCFDSSIKIISLILPNSDPHNYQLTPQDRITLEHADLIIQNGIGLEPYLDKIKLKNKVDVSQNLDLIYLKINSNTNLKNKNISSADPHIWQSPVLMQKIVANVTKEIVKFDEKNKKKYLECSNKYSNKIKLVYKNLKTKVTKLSATEKTIVTNHDALAYFAKDFGFEIRPLMGLSDDEMPTQKDLENLIQFIKTQKIKLIYLETSGQNKMMETVAKNANVALGKKIYGDNLGETQEPAGTLIGMWEENVRRILESNGKSYF